MKRLILLSLLFFVIFALGCIGQGKQQEKKVEPIETQVLVNGKAGHVEVYSDSTSVMFVKVKNNLKRDLKEPKIYWSGCGEINKITEPNVIRAGGMGILKYELNLSSISIPEGSNVECYIEGDLCFNQTDLAYTDVSIYVSNPTATLYQGYDSNFLSITFNDQYVKSNRTSTMTLKVENVGDGYVFLPDTFEPNVLRSITFNTNNFAIKEIAGESFNGNEVKISSSNYKSLLRLVDGRYLELPIKIKANEVTEDTLTRMEVKINYTYCIHLPTVYLTIKS